MRDREICDLLSIAEGVRAATANCSFERGVNSDSAVATLLGRSLVAEVGRRETAGRPALLGVTPECLQYLGVRSLTDLPPLPATEPA